MSFFSSLCEFLSSIIILQCWEPIINALREFKEEKQLLGFLEATKRELQKNRYARIWAFISLGLSAAALRFLSFTKRFNFHDFPHVKKARSGDIYFIILVVLFSIIHLSVLFFAPQIRRFRYVRAQPIPLIMALGATVLAYIPIVCSIDESLGDENLDWYALKTVVCFIFEFFSLHMAVLPHFDYMVVHMSLGILNTIVLGISRVKKTTSEDRIWLIMAGAALVNVIVLTIHHWLTVPATCADWGTIIDDGRPIDQRNDEENWVRPQRPVRQQSTLKIRVVSWLKGGLGHGIGLVVWLVLVIYMVKR